jgi:DNA-binding CsgD family transcriptional regulator
MHTDGSEDGKDVLPPPPLLIAREAFLTGDLGACFAALDALVNETPTEMREATLLRARALLRQHRARDAVELLGPSLDGFAGIDEACTARMLHAIGVVRCGDTDQGMALLREVEGAARALQAHPTVRAEIAYWIAYAHWIRRDYVAALKSARIAEAEQADVVSVRAASLRGYIAVAKERYAEALALFRSALESYGRCRERDPDLAERITVQIASLELTLRSRAVPGTHRFRSAGASISDAGTRGVAGGFRVPIAVLDGWLYTFDDDRERAYRCARVAERLVPSQSWRVWALANRANIALAFDEPGIAAEFAAEALEVAEAIDWPSTTDEERVGLLLLAEALAVTNSPAAARVLERYDGLTTELDRSLLFRDDVRLWIVEQFVHGLVDRIAGNCEKAVARLKEVSDAALRVGYLWRAALALIELDATPQPCRQRDSFYLDEAAQIITEHFSGSFLARRLGRWMNAASDPIVARLARVPREVLRRLLDGKTHKEIAVDMHLAPGTVKNYVVAIHRNFGVTSTPQLMAECYRRGIGVPSWNQPPSSPRQNITRPAVRSQERRTKTG